MSNTVSLNEYPEKIYAANPRIMQNIHGVESQIGMWLTLKPEGMCATYIREDKFMGGSSESQICESVGEQPAPPANFNSTLIHCLAGKWIFRHGTSELEITKEQSEDLVTAVQSAMESQRGEITVDKPFERYEEAWELAKEIVTKQGHYSDGEPDYLTDTYVVYNEVLDFIQCLPKREYRELSPEELAVIRAAETFILADIMVTPNMSREQAVKSGYDKLELAVNRYHSGQPATQIEDGASNG